MKPEERLDRLIELREHGIKPLVADDEMAAGLAAAQALSRLNDIDVPPAFAQRLEQSIRARARAHAWQQDRDLPTTSPLCVTPAARPLHVQRHKARNGWVALLGIAAALVLAGVSILTASTRSLPGDALYGLKQAEVQFTINLAGSPRARISDQLNQLHSELTDLTTVVKDGRGDDAVRLALNTLATDTNSAQSAVAALPAGTDHDTAQQNLDSVLSEEDNTMRGLLGKVDWSMRVAITSQLGSLGDPVPGVTRVTLLIQGYRRLTITLTGTHFAPGARLVINGQLAGTVIKQTQGQLVVVISNASLPYGVHTVGILNPDGTAAQFTYGKDNDNDQQEDNNVWYGTPEPTRDSGSSTGDD
jgi:hypothetical protein